jgi:hypothetical protein
MLTIIVPAISGRISNQRMPKRHTRFVVPGHPGPKACGIRDLLAPTSGARPLPYPGCTTSMSAIHSNTNLALVHSRESADEDLLNPSNRRAHERLTVSALSWLTRVRLKYGPAVTLIDLSSGGAQIETTSPRIQPGRTVVVEIGGCDSEFALPSLVLRCHVSGIAPHTVYRGALQFKRPLNLPHSEGGRCAPEGNPNPSHELARLQVALRRTMGVLGASVHAETGGLTLVGAASLAAAHAMIESPSGRRAGEPFSRELCQLFKMITRWVESDQPVDMLLAELTERLRRVIPARSIRLIDATSLLTLAIRDALAFDVPSATAAGTKLLVEFPRNCRPQERHLQLLKVAAHLIALITHIEQARRLARERVRREESLGHPPGWHLLVVRYTDGRMMKGFSRDFAAEKGQVSVWPMPDGPPNSRITVFLAHVKAVFFVHEFDGHPRMGDVGGTPLTAGRRIAVTFLDGEVLTGTTLNYSAKGPGFFVAPIDGTTNNHRIFVVGTAVRRVQFP